MAAALTPDPPVHGMRRPLGPRLLGGAALVALVAGIWWASTQQATVTRKAAEDSVLIPVVPPPPPPPPPEVKPPEPKPDEVPPPQNQPKPTPQPPNPQPQAATPSQGQAVSIDGPAQAGGDAFNIGSGSGSGMRGGGAIGNALGGFNRAAYTSYLEGEFQRAWQAEKQLRTAALSARVRVWIDRTGRVTRVEATGTDMADAIRDALVGRSVRPPDPALGMPVALSLDIRRS